MLLVFLGLDIYAQTFLLPITCYGSLPSPWTFCFLASLGVGMEYKIPFFRFQQVTMFKKLVYYKPVF